MRYCFSHLEQKKSIGTIEQVQVFISKIYVSQLRALQICDNEVEVNS